MCAPDQSIIAGISLCFGVMLVPVLWLWFENRIQLLRLDEAWEQRDAAIGEVGRLGRREAEITKILQTETRR